MTGKYRLRCLAVLLCAALLLSGCGAEGLSRLSMLSGADPTLPEGAEPYSVPPFLGSGFDESQARDFGGIRVDTSGVALGYLSVQATGENRMKFQVSCGDQQYTYDVSNTGATEVIPMNMGSGSYTCRLLENVGESRYACLWMEEVPVQLEDEFQCFLRPSQMVNYNESSECVKQARHLAQQCQTDTDVAAAIYRYLVRNIAYDHEKAATVAPGYLPDPDDTLASGKGICFDYASLAAAMMRSLGIPCKLITGYVDGSLYHAWNTFYTKEHGWVTVEIKATPNVWQRVDITMAAGGTSTKELTDDSKYTTRFTY